MSANEEHLDIIRKMQHRALRICSRVDIRTLRIELSRAELPLLTHRRLAHLRHYMYKCSKIESYVDNSDIITRAHAAPLFKIPNSDTKIVDKVFW